MMICYHMVGELWVPRSCPDNKEYQLVNVHRTKFGFGDMFHMPQTLALQRTSLQFQC